MECDIIIKANSLFDSDLVKQRQTKSKKPDKTKQIQQNQTKSNKTMHSHKNQAKSN